MIRGIATSIIGLLIAALFISGCSNSSEEDVRNLPGLDPITLTISGEVIDTREHDYSIRLKNDQGESSWISVGAVNYPTIENGTTMTITCSNIDCYEALNISF